MPYFDRFPHRKSDSLASLSFEPRSAIPLSPASTFAYSETDPFLSPRASQPPSPYLPLPPTPRTASGWPSPLHTPLSSPGVLDLPHKNGFFTHLHIPPSAKRARSRTWLVAAGGLLFFVAFVVLTSHAIAPQQLREYSEKASEKFAQVKSWRTGVEMAEGAGEVEEQAVQDEVEALAIPAEGEIRISALPAPRRPLDDPDAKYLGFLPHSGYHNQRTALQNALLLGKLLNRTVLLPPVWIGWPVPTQYYAELRRTWLDVMLTSSTAFNISTLTNTSSLNAPADYRSSTADFACPWCYADNAHSMAEQQASAERKKAKYLAQGWQIRPDGYPIVPGMDLSQCKSYAPECRASWTDTFLAWDALVDLDRLDEVGVKVVDRWDLRERALEDLLDVTEDDVYILEDRQPYDFHFIDRSISRTDLIVNNTDTSHWNRDVSIATLVSDPHKVLLVGSLFGTGRISTSPTRNPDAGHWKEIFGRAMAFKNPWLLRPANAIVSRLGGASNYVGVHARVGDGGFLRNARKNCEGSWRLLAADRLGVRDDVVDEMWERVKPVEEVEGLARQDGRARSGRGHLAKVRRAEADSPLLVERSPWADVDGEYGELDPEEFAVVLQKRGLIDATLDWFSSAPSASPDNLRNLTCRGPLHTEWRFRAFNTPLYLATDSRTPETDPNLRIFFDAFPCTFILSDFDRAVTTRNDGLTVKSVGEMGRLVNDLDGVALGRLFLPFLEAIVAAKAKETVGTPGSTFSGFAAGQMHRAYWSE
ncbi:hypothetical protein JCM10207_004988 [Rhodosporidiobolus poonsookiae]